MSNIIDITKNTGDTLTASEFNQVTSAINTVNNNTVTNTASIATNTTSISTLNSGLSTANSNISSIETTVSTKANSDDVYTKTETYDKDEVDSLVRSVTISAANISTTETVYGNIELSGTNYTLYRRMFNVTSLPTVSGVTTDIVISDSPMGYNLFCYIDGFSLSSGVNMKSQFLLNLYTINDIYVNDSLQTVLNVTCNTTTSTSYTMYLVLLYIKPDFHEVDLNISLPTTVTVSNVTFKIPELKFNKKSIFTNITDDAYAQINRFSNLVRGRHINVNTGNWAEWVHTDGSGNDTCPYAADGNLTWEYPAYPITFSDGCGNLRYITNSCIVWPATPNYTLNYATDWSDMLDFGISPDFHDVWDPVNDPTGTVGYGTTQESFDTCVSATRTYVYNNLAARYMKGMVTPNGDENYINYDINNALIDFHTFDKSPGVYRLPYVTDLTLAKDTTPILRYFESFVPEAVEAMNQANPSNSTKSDRKWVILGNHRLGQEYIGMQLMLYNTRYFGGSDDTWGTSLDEYYEYWYNKNNCIKSVITGTNAITYKMYIPKIYNFYYPSTSILASGIYDNQTKALDTLSLYGTATCSGQFVVTRGVYSDTVVYSLGDTSEYLAYKLSQSTNFTDSVLSVDGNKVTFASNNSGKIYNYDFVDNSGSKQVVTYTITNPATAAAALSFHLDNSENDLSYTTSASLTAISICDSIKSSFATSPYLIGWDLDQTTGTNTLVFTKLYNYKADSPTFTAGTTGVTATVAITNTGSNPSGIRGAWRKSIDGLTITSTCEGLSYGIDRNSESTTYQVTKLTITNNVTTSGTLTLNIDGIDYSIPVTTDDNTPALVAAAIASQTFTTLDVSYTSGNAYIDFTTKRQGSFTPSLTANGTGVAGNFTVTTAGTEPAVLINVSYGDSLVTNATKYVNRYIANKTVDNAYDAQYQVNLISDQISQKATLQATLDSYLKTPILTSFKLNNGDSSTDAVTVSATMVSSITPTYYILSESSDFSGASWQPWSSTASFVLSDTSGSHTVYAKVKNANGESNTLNSSITYTPADITLSAVSINSGASSTTTRTVTLTYTSTGGTPTQYMASESSDFSDASWTNISTPISFVLSTGSGTKTVYFKVKNNYYTSTSVSSSITYTPAAFGLESLTINNGDSTATSLTVSGTIVYTGETTPTGYKLGEDSTLANETSYTTYSGNPLLYTFTSYGDKTLYCKITDGTNTSSIVSDTISIIQPVTLSGITINSGATSTDTATVSIALSYTGTPTYYMVSESSSFSGASWVTFTSSPISYTFTSTGSKTLYVKIKNAAGESSSQSASISYIQTVKVVMVNVSAATVDSTYGYLNSQSTDNTATIAMKDTNQVARCNYQGAYYYHSTILGYAQALDSTITAINDAGSPNTAYLVNSCTFTTTGTYPNDYIWNSTNKYSNAPTLNHLWTQPSVLYYTGLDAGSYKVRVLLNWNVSWNMGTDDLYILVNDAAKQTIAGSDLGSGGKYQNNNSNWIEFDNVTVTSAGYLMLLAGWSAQNNNQNLAGPTVAILEITKTA